MNTPTIVIWASGSGSNAENIIRSLHPQKVVVAAVYCNNPHAGVIERAKRLNIPLRLFENADLLKPSQVDAYLEKDRPDLIVLAGFLRQFPQRFIDRFKTINLHPALLPKHGGKGMFGHHVHKAVIEAKESESGITFHWVNEHYDQGGIIAQFSCPVLTSDTPETLAQSIHTLEQEHFPSVLLSIFATQPQP
jgi:phosphoribosylglycinamide formyltransferase-1